MAGTGVGKFSSTAGNNTSNMTTNFAENMAPSNVNNAARELMAHMRDMYEQLGDGYFEFGDGDGEYTVTRGDADTITITGTSDITSVYYVGRKIRITDGGGNVVEGVISGSSHSSTTQTIDLTGISLASGTPTKVELGIDTAAFGGKIILDDDGDTYIEAVTDDTIDFYAGGTKIGTFTTTTVGFNDGVTVTTNDNTDTLQLISTDADASSGPNLRLYRNNDSNADADVLGVIEFEGRNDNSQDVRYVQLTSQVNDITDGEEDGSLYINTMVAGANSNRINIVPTEVVFNDESKDLDFRVESNGNSHMIFVDGNNDHVNIGTSTHYDGRLNIETTDNTFNLTLISTDADANAGPNMKFYRNSGSPADADITGNIYFTGRNDNSQDVNYAHIETLISDASDTTEDGYMNIYVAHAGTQARSRIEMDSTEMVINEGGADLDFRVESDGVDKMLFVNAGTNTVSIGGEATPLGRLHVFTADSSASAHANADEFVIEGSAYSGMTIASGTTSHGTIAFADSGDELAGRIIYNHNTNIMSFGTAGVGTQWSIDASGNQLAGNSTGQGIYFGVTSATASNLLNDYETGTFTPTLNGSASAPSGVSYNKRLGWYEKVGDMVTVHVHLDSASMTAVPAGALTVTGLPFTCVNTTGFLHAGVVSLTSNFASTESPQANYINPNTTALNFLCNDSNDARDNIGDAITCANAMSGNETLIASCTYRSA